MSVNINEIISFTGSDNEFNPYPQMDSRYGPYESIDTALSALNASKRCIGLTVGIKNNNSITEYWFKGGILDSNLVEKSDDTYLNYKLNGGSKTKSEFYTTMGKIIDTSAYVILNSNTDNIKVEVTLSNGDPVEIGSSSTSSTLSKSALLQITTRNIDISLPDGQRTISVSTSNGESSEFILANNIVNWNYSNENECTVTISLPLSIYNYFVGFYDSNTGNLLSNEQTYTFITPSNGESYITMLFNPAGPNTTSTTTYTQYLNL